MRVAARKKKGKAEEKSEDKYQNNANRRKSIEEMYHRKKAVVC